MNRVQDRIDMQTKAILIEGLDAAESDAISELGAVF
jgi:hypothetical protein